MAERRYALKLSQLCHALCLTLCENDKRKKSFNLSRIDFKIIYKKGFKKFQENSIIEMSKQYMT